jgi:hypothetical protein
MESTHDGGQAPRTAIEQQQPVRPPRHPERERTREEPECRVRRRPNEPEPRGHGVTVARPRTAILDAPWPTSRTPAPSSTSHRSRRSSARASSRRATSSISSAASCAICCSPARRRIGISQPRPIRTKRPGCSAGGRIAATWWARGSARSGL